MLCWYPYFMSCFLVSNVPELQNPNVPTIDYFILPSEFHQFFFVFRIMESKQNASQV